MSALFKIGSGLQMQPAAVFVLRLGILLLPSALLLGAALRDPGAGNLLLWVATAFQAAVAGLSFLSRRGWRQPLGPSVITLYLVALAWLWCGDSANDWYTHLTKATLLVVPLGVFGFQTLHDSGAPAIRRARLLADRLAHRKEWPADLSACRTLPEVKALRAALTIDAAPALALLRHPRQEVRIAALTALEFRKDWRPGQAELVLQVAQRAEQPTVRAAAVCALANVDDRSLVEAVAQFMHDPSTEVRRSATESLLWDTDHRWSWIRYIVRRVLADPLYANDGALAHEGQLLTPDAVGDLTGWCAEKGVLASRAALTLGHHYSRALNEQPDQKLVRSLQQQLAEPQTPAVLRIELGRLLQYHQELDVPLLEQLLQSSNPAPLRLIAVETLLADHGEEPAAKAALGTLRDLARLPNREIALATADVIQRRLGVDLGLGLGQPLPPVHSRQAADVTRRVMVWASQYDLPENVEDSRPLEESRV
jgi:HEAT repeat protein